MHICGPLILSMFVNFQQYGGKGTSFKVKREAISPQSYAKPRLTPFYPSFLPSLTNSSLWLSQCNFTCSLWLPHSLTSPPNLLESSMLVCSGAQATLSDLTLAQGTEQCSHTHLFSQLLSGSVCSRDRTARLGGRGTFHSFIQQILANHLLWVGAGVQW